LNTTPTTSVTDFTQQVGQLMQSYNTVYFARELQAFRETVNVNCVDYPRGLDCCIRGECVYSHPIDSGASRAQDWKCAQCCVTVESEACPFCMQARPTLHSQTIVLIVELSPILTISVSLSILLCLIDRIYSSLKFLFDIHRISHPPDPCIILAI